MYYVACYCLLGYIKGLPDGAYEVTRDVGDQLNVTCRCSDGTPLWLLVNANNVSETYLVRSSSDPLPTDTEFIQKMEIMGAINYTSTTIIMNLTYSVVLQCSNYGMVPNRTRPLVVAVNIEPGGISHTVSSVSCSLCRLSICVLFSYLTNSFLTISECPSATPCQLTTPITANSTTDMIPTQTSTCSRHM